MASVRRRSLIPGLAPQANKEIVDLQDDIIQALADLRQESVGSTTDTKAIATYAAKYNEFIRALPAAAGLDIVFPPASAQTANRWIWILKVGGGNVRLKATSGKIQGVTTVQTLTTNGLYIYQSDGRDSWWSTIAAGGGGLTPPVALTDLQNIGDETFLGNVSGAAAPPSAIALSSLAGTGLTWNSAANRLDASGGGGALTLLTTEVNLGSRPTYSGSFTIAGVGMSVGKPVLIQQAVGPYTGKGTLADEAEEQVTASASVTSATLITAYWKASGGPVSGNIKFNYAVSA